MRRVAIVVHGLNVKPEKMDVWANVLAEEGTLSLRVALTGHHGDPEAWSHVTNAQWLDDTEEAYRLARAAADTRKVPLLYLGYSLGGLMAAELAAVRPEVNFRVDQLVLLAPALSIHFGATLAGSLSFLGEEIRIPSLAAPEYKANSEGTSLAAYHALVEGVRALKNRSMPSLNSPALVIMDPDDGLVSYRGLKELTRDKGLDRWKFLTVTTAGGVHPATVHHFLLDESGFGSWVWSELRSRVIRFIRGEEADGTITRSDFCGQTGVWKTHFRSDCRQDYWTGCSRDEFDCRPVFRGK